MARNAIAKKSIVLTNGQPSGVTFAFADGKVLTVQCDDLPDNVVNLATCHGLSQKIGDSYSKTTGPVDARQKAEATIKALMDGDWNAKADTTTDLALALHRITGHPLEDCAVKVQDMDAKAKAALQKHKQIKVELQRIRLERAEASITDDDDDTLASLMED